MNNKQVDACKKYQMQDVEIYPCPVFLPYGKLSRQMPVQESQSDAFYIDIYVENAGKSAAE